MSPRTKSYTMQEFYPTGRWSHSDSPCGIWLKMCRCWRGTLNSEEVILRQEMETVSLDKSCNIRPLPDFIGNWYIPLRLSKDLLCLISIRFSNNLKKTNHSLSLSFILNGVLSHTSPLSYCCSACQTLCLGCHMTFTVMMAKKKCFVIFDLLDFGQTLPHLCQLQH